ncbi:MAG: hypothetical protein J5625_08030 [Lachnospiraceae bacterium]|nr:hypothetical protein [Lachnospiraceae bacterium]
MKRKTLALLTALVAALSLTGCNIVDFLNTPLFESKEEQIKEEDFAVLPEISEEDLTRIAETLEEEEEIDAFGLFAGRWICEDGSYCEVFTRAEDGEKGIVYYDNETGLLTEAYYVTASLTDKENNLYALSYPMGGNNFEIYSVKLSEDNQSFENIDDQKTFERVDETLWSGINIMYIYPIQSLCIDSFVWSEESAYKDKSERMDRWLYFVTDLDWDGYPEILKSGFYKGEKQTHTYIYEYTPGDAPQMMDCEVLYNHDLINPVPSFYGSIFSTYSVDTDGPWSVYKYEVSGNEDYSSEDIFLQEYLMCIKNNTVSLEKICAQSIAEETLYYDAEGKEISKEEYNDIMHDNWSDNKVFFEGFTDITLGNMIESMKKFTNN